MTAAQPVEPGARVTDGEAVGTVLRVERSQTFSGLVARRPAREEVYVLWFPDLDEQP